MPFPWSSSTATALRAAGVVATYLGELDPKVAVPIDPCPDVVALLDGAVHEDESGAMTIRPGFAPDLDRAIADVRETREWLAALEGVERQRTGIRSLKVGFNKVFGYYLEVTRPNLHLAPADYVRKQTVATGERFVTAPLKEAEARVLAADEEIAACEREALTRLSEHVIAEAARITATARVLAELDAFLALAEVAVRNDWSAPEIDEGDALEIVAGRHPVVEAHLGGEPFIPNDCRLGGESPRQAIVTGPNMAGKSTWLRQNALIVLLAQIGSWVPARRARIGLVDRIFTRVGAQDDLARGQSTFMIEMVETAAILHQATNRSLLILDEVGRGTSTADGLAIARATLEDISRRIGARALFATHYLELSSLAGELPDVTNVHVGAMEREGRVVFLYAIRPGAADRAYGVQVARLAGLPPWVADRAEALLAVMPRPEQVSATPSRMIAEAGERRELLRVQEAGSSPAERLAMALRELDLNDVSPRQALEWLWQEQGRLVDAESDTGTSNSIAGDGIP